MDDRFYMQLALDLAEKTKGQTSPNPMVGAVVVKDGRIVGMGAHLKAGDAHAEVQALDMAGKHSANSTIYVTLEPCSHFGKTPPCAERIIRDQVKRVVVATKDPNPLVAGRGIEIIKKAGIELTLGVLEEEAKVLNEAFNKYISTEMPFVTVKTAMTLDGKIASHTGSSKWITSELARKYVHQIRHEHDAIMVGLNTLLQDDPTLTVRNEQQGLNPIRVILDTNLAIPLDAKVLTDKSTPTWIFSAANVEEQKLKKLEKLGAKVIMITGSQTTQVELREVLKYLGSKGVTSVLVEGGAKLIGSFFDKQLIDKYIGFIAPKLIGGNNSPTSIGGIGIANMSEAVALDNITLATYGEDICITGYPTY